MNKLSKKIRDIKKRTAALLMSAVVIVTASSCKDTKNVGMPKDDTPDKSMSDSTSITPNTDIEQDIIIDNENYAWGGGQASESDPIEETEKKDDTITSDKSSEGSLDVQNSLKTNEELAREVIKGLWGNGVNRINALTAAGYDYVAIQDIVNAMLNNTYKPETPKKEEEKKPETTETVETPSTHTHEFSDWQALNELKEFRSCSCEEMEIRGHSYEEASFEKIPNYTFNTYEEIMTESCRTCGYIHEEKETKNMTFTPWYYDATRGQDVRDCLEFNYTETKDHIHDFKTLKNTDDNYEYWTCECGNTHKIKHNFDKGTDNKDGTITYNCTNDLCDYSKTKSKPSPSHSSSSSTSKPETHTHEYTEFVSSTDEEETWKCPQDDATIKKPHGIFRFLRSLKELGEEWLCETCNHKKTVNHNLTYHIEDDTKVYTCTTPGCDYTYTEAITPGHTHEYTEFVSSTAEEETWKCKDDETTITKPHNLSPTGTYNKDTNEVEYKCLNAGCDYTKKELHSEHIYKIDNGKATRAHEILVCEICGNNTTKAHEFNDGTEENCIVTYSCNHEDCTYTYQEENHDYDADISYYNNDPTYCYRKTETCSKCGDTIETDVEHDWQKKYESAFGHIEYCSRSGNCHVEEKEVYYDIPSFESPSSEELTISDEEHSPIDNMPIEEQIIFPSLEIEEEVTESEIIEEEIEEYQTEETVNGFNIYYKTPSLTQEEKPLILSRRKGIERNGMY